MLKAIWKINLGESLVHDLPMGAEPLYADYQPQSDGSQQICVWLLVNVNARKLKRAFLVAGTGWTLPEFVRVDHHIASCRNPDNRNCWHIFDLGYLEDMKPFERTAWHSTNEKGKFDGSEE